MPNGKRNGNRRKFNQRQNVRGQGDYKIPKFVKKALKQSAKIAKQSFKNTFHPGDFAESGGASLGGRIGRKFGHEKIGRTIGRNLARAAIEGMGDYRIQTNSLFSHDSSGTVVPVFSADGKRGIRICEREFIGDVLSGLTAFGVNSTAFTNQTYRINPSDPTTFPWLHQIAKLFDQWQPNGLIFEFVSTSSTFNGTNQALGVVMMATDYDVSDPPFGNKIQLENSAYSCSTSPSQNLMHGIECDPKERALKVMYTGDARTGTPLSMHDLANFQIATQGVSEDRVTLGELWVTYDITFFKKSINEEYIPEPHYHLASVSATTGVIISSFFLAAEEFAETTDNTMHMVVTYGVSPRFTFPVNAKLGRYRVTFGFEYAGDDFTKPPTPLITTGSVTTIRSYNEEMQVASTIAAATATAIVNLTAEGQYFIVNVPNSNAALKNIYLTVEKVADTTVF